MKYGACMALMPVAEREIKAHCRHEQGLLTLESVMCYRSFN